VTSAADSLATLVAEGTPISRAQAEWLLADPDLVGTGILGEQARRAVTGSRVTYGRVLEAPGDVPAAGLDEAGEVRLTGRPASSDEAVDRVRRAAARVTHVPLTGFVAADLLGLAGGDPAALVELAGALRAAGLEAVAELPLDALTSTDEAIAVVGAFVRAGLAVPRATVHVAPLAARLALVERAAAVQAATGALRAFAPLPRHDSADLPSTGYDDVRTIAVARLMLRSIRCVQVDWPLYGPKLAQVAIAYGANDIDGVAVVDHLNLGHRRSPREEIERQIRAASADPAERDGRYAPRS
jgi:aminodeoxyfutalosine synthase